MKIRKFRFPKKCFATNGECIKCTLLCSSILTSDGCDYCKHMKSILETENPHRMIFIQENVLVFGDYGGIVGTPIKYCPMCARPLHEEER